MPAAASSNTVAGSGPTPPCANSREQTLAGCKVLVPAELLLCADACRLLEYVQ